MCCPSTLLFLHGNTSTFFPNFCVQFLGWPYTSGDLLPPALAPGCLSCPARDQGLYFTGAFPLQLHLGTVQASCSPWPDEARRKNSRICDCSGAEAGPAFLNKHMVQALAVVAVRLLYRLVLSLDC